ncbi:hypothetical protein KC19_5G081600 [Ceratodon purpureus]|uniref:Uncharacterized protein n=1 Tax=Ceratodon purpureus TaxID=3225 RepID=A0A8T0I0A6_CERPU|nr:hypothetical protein KC19_5G081600 [Ceratodon purpureus]
MSRMGSVTVVRLAGKCALSTLVNFVLIRIAEGTASTLLLRTQRILANRQFIVAQSSRL